MRYENRTDWQQIQIATDLKELRTDLRHSGKNALCVGVTVIIDALPNTNDASVNALLAHYIHV